MRRRSRCCPKGWMKFFKAVCDEPRQKILSLLREHEKMNASEIIKKMKLSQPTVSHHLKILCDAEIITSQKKGKEVYYELLEKNIADCCMGFMKMFKKKS